MVSVRELVKDWIIQSLSEKPEQAELSERVVWIHRRECADLAGQAIELEEDVPHSMMDKVLDRIIWQTFRPLIWLLGKTSK